MTAGLSKRAIFSTSARNFFRSFRDRPKANIIIQYYLVPRRLFTDLMIRDLK